MATEIKKVKKRIYLILKDVDPNTKCPPQSRLIVDTIKSGGGKMEREELLTLLKRPPDQGGLKTNQTAERILGFYKPKLIADGILREDEETIEVEVEVPDKPAKAEQAEQAAAAGAEGGEHKPKKGGKGHKGEHQAA